MSRGGLAGARGFSVARTGRAVGARGRRRRADSRAAAAADRNVRRGRNATAAVPSETAEARNARAGADCRGSGASRLLRRILPLSRGGAARGLSPSRASGAPSARAARRPRLGPFVDSRLGLDSSEGRDGLAGRSTRLLSSPPPSLRSRSTGLTRSGRAPESGGATLSSGSSGWPRRGVAVGVESSPPPRERLRRRPRRTHRARDDARVPLATLDQRRPYCLPPVLLPPPPADDGGVGRARAR